MAESLGARIQSIKDTVNGGYVKPSQEKLDSFCQALNENERARDYLRITRGLNPETIDNFKLGYDRDKDAIAIPVFKRGELVNIRYRYLEPKGNAKYTQEKGCEVWLYNEDGIDKGQAKKGVLITEGEFDCMSAWQAGFKNVVSPASGKDSYGIWLELLDTIPKVYIAYDNDKPGKTASMAIAERIGTEKSFEVSYPEGIKDANEYFKTHDAEAYKELIRSARPFYKYTYAGVVDVIASLREKSDNFIKLDTVPFVEFEDGYLTVLSGVTNVGKTSYALNVTQELINQGIPVLFLPIERGIKDVGKRFLQVRYDKTKEGVRQIADEEWDKIIPDVVDLPLYFAHPKPDEVEDIIRRGRRLFNTKFIVIDHLDLLTRKADPKSYNVELAGAIQKLKQIAQELDIIVIAVHHIRKQEGVGAIPKKPSLNDLKGSGSVKDDPEAVIMLSIPEKGQIEVEILKNKGEMGSAIYKFDSATGKMGEDITSVVGIKAMSLDDF